MAHPRGRVGGAIEEQRRGPVPAQVVASHRRVGIDIDVAQCMLDPLTNYRSHLVERQSSAVLTRDGGLILDDALSPAEVDALVAELRPYVETF